ncbi:MAG: TetR/AcrR family transcriptional regulator [Clostridiales bacterium]|nr:TetR/AcrR family transcriptional regulator [Clostridiales bacterium]
MPNTKNKTTDKIQQCLTDMLQSCSIEDITATELCNRANVNRATFYYHYDSVQDVLAAIEAKLESEFVQWMSQYDIDSNGLPEKSFYVSFFEFVARNAGVCRMLLNTQRPSDEFMARVIEAGRTKVVSIMSRYFPQCPAAKIDYYYIFVANGFLGLLGYWLNSGMKESVNVIAEIGERISTMGVAYLA